MRKSQHAVIWLLTLIVAVPGLVSAGNRGRLVGRVVDLQGAPVEGVSVTATSPAVPDFKKELITDRKGTFIIDFQVLDVTYHYRFEKAGYQTVEVDQKWDLEGTARHDFVMHPGQTPTTSAVAPASTSKPAVDAYNAGVAALDAKDYATAQAKLEEALRDDPKLSQAWAVLGVVRLRQEQYQEAVDDAEKAMALGAADETVLRTRWEAYRKLGDEAKTAQALTDLQRFGRMTEDAKKAHNEAVALVKAGNHEGAFAKFKEAAQIDPSLKEAVVGMAVEALAVKRYDDALSAVATILKDDPQNAQALRIRYNAALGLGDEPKLVDALVAIAPVEPALARDGLLQLAYKAYDANDMAKAETLFEKVLQVDPNQVQSNYLLALIDVNNGAKEEAKQHLQRFLELAPNDQDAATAKQLLDYLNKQQ